MADYGISAGNQKNYLQTVNGSLAPDASSALRVLSLSLPNFLGGSPIAPDALLRPGLSTSAQLGGGSAPAGPPSALSSLSAQVGGPAPSGGSLGSTAPFTPPPTPTFNANNPSPPQPFSQAPIAQLATSALAPTPPNSTPLPTIAFGGASSPMAPTGQAPAAPAGNGVAGLAQLIGNLQRGGGGVSGRQV